MVSDIARAVVDDLSKWLSKGDISQVLANLLTQYERGFCSCCGSSIGGRFDSWSHKGIIATSNFDLLDPVAPPTENAVEHRHDLSNFVGFPYVISILEQIKYPNEDNEIE